MAEREDEELSTPQIASLAEVIPSVHFESISLALRGVELAHTKASRRRNPDAAKRELIGNWVKRNPGPNQAQVTFCCSN